MLDLQRRKTKIRNRVTSHQANTALARMGPQGGLKQHILLSLHSRTYQFLLYPLERKYARDATQCPAAVVNCTGANNRQALYEHVIVGTIKQNVVCSNTTSRACTKMWGFNTCWLAAPILSFEIFIRLFLKSPFSAKV